MEKEKPKTEKKEKPKEKPKEDPKVQANLFGETDEIYNTLETELTMVNIEIDAAQKTIERKETEIEGLQVRQQSLLHAIFLIRKNRKESEPGKEKTQEQKVPAPKKEEKKVDAKKK